MRMKEDAAGCGSAKEQTCDIRTFEHISTANSTSNSV